MAGGTAASLWRIEFARELMRSYEARPGAVGAFVAGSAARGMADEWSDIDIVVVWDPPDVAFLAGAPLHARGAERFTHVAGDDGSGIEQYRVGSLKVDVANMSVAGLGELVDDVMVRHGTGWTHQKVFEGFGHGVPLFGADVLETWQVRMAAYPREVAVAMVREHLAFYPRWAPERMGLDRNDILTYTDLVMKMVKNVGGILAGLNRVWFASASEPKHLVGMVEAMPLRPADAATVLDDVIRAPSAAALVRLERVILETLDLVDAHLPEIPTTRTREVLALPAEPCHAPPVLPP